MAGGRPTLYDPAYCERVIELGKEGKSPVQIACALDVARATLYAWADEHPEFLTAFTRAKEFAQAWFEDQGQAGLAMPTGQFNANLWKKQVECRFREDYTEQTRTELTGANGGPVKVDATVALDPGEAYRRMLEG
jgi:hypothetical protein